MKIETRINKNTPERHLEGHTYLSFLTDRNYLTFATGAGDHWIGINAFNARFRHVGCGGGTSPETFDALGLFRTKIVSGEDLFSSMPIHHDFSVTRREDDSWTDLTVSLSASAGYSLVLDRPEQGPDSMDRAFRQEFHVAPDNCPPLMLAAFANLAYAMLQDNGQTLNIKGEATPLRPIDKRFLFSAAHRMERQFKLGLDFA